MGIPIQKHAVFDLSSVTRASTLATYLTILPDQGKFNLSERLKYQLPQLWVISDDVMTIRKAVTHTSGLNNTLSYFFTFFGNYLSNFIFVR